MKNTEEKKTKQKNWFKECFLERRFFVLVLGALLGIALFLFVKNMIYYQKYFSIVKKLLKTMIYYQKYFSIVKKLLKT